MLNVRTDERIVLVAFGGFDKAVGADRWPVTPGVRWLVPANWATERSDMTVITSYSIHYTKLYDVEGEAKTSPATAASARPGPTKPAKAG